MNPKSCYNKINEFKAFVEDEEVDILFMSESWERESKTLQDIIKLDDHIVISNVHQRRGVGGRPALIVTKISIQFRTLHSVIQVPWGVEVVWALVTPKNIHNDSKI